MKKILFFITAVLLCFGQTSAWAQCNHCSLPTVVLGTQADSANRTDNQVYAGLSWALDNGNGFIPDLLFGARSLNVSSNNGVNGADVNVRIRYKNQISFDSLRLSYVGGSREFMGNVGMGYSFAKGGYFGTAAAQAAYSRMGVDYLFSERVFNPYLEGNSLYTPQVVNAVAGTTGSISCSGINNLVDAAVEGASANQTANGQTCSTPPSDRRLKRSIHLLATLDSGIKIYSFKYLWSDIVYVGVMAQDLLANPQWKTAVVTGKNNFYAVDYHALGLKMTTLQDWNKKGLSSILLSPTIN
jgi:hypothetical protein